MKPRPKRKRTDLDRLYALVRSYCRRERADVDVGSPEMVRDWHKICLAVGVNPMPKWERFSEVDIFPTRPRRRR